MSKLYQLKLEHFRHRGAKIWFHKDGTIYYGKDNENLICPEGHEMMGWLPPFTLKDLVNAFLLGQQVEK